VGANQIFDDKLGFSSLVNAMKKKKVTGLDIRLEELRTGKVHKYKSVKVLVSDVWG
jgi:hypothetical protein